MDTNLFSSSLDSYFVQLSHKKLGGIFSGYLFGHQNWIFWSFLCILDFSRMGIFWGLVTFQILFLVCLIFSFLVNSRC